MPLSTKTRTSISTTSKRNGTKSWMPRWKCSWMAWSTSLAWLPCVHPLHRYMASVLTTLLDRRQGQVSHCTGIFSSGIACRVDGKPPSRLTYDQAFHRFQTIIWSQVKAANSLLSITHSLKLLLLLSDEAQIAHRRDVELKHVQQEKIEAQQKVAALLDELFKRPCTSSSI